MNSNKVYDVDEIIFYVPAWEFRENYGKETFSFDGELNYTYVCTVKKHDIYKVKNVLVGSVQNSPLAILLEWRRTLS
jgi:hypothetical protein